MMGTGWQCYNEDYPTAETSRTYQAAAEILYWGSSSLCYSSTPVQETLNMCSNGCCQDAACLPLSMEVCTDGTVTIFNFNPFAGVSFPVGDGTWNVVCTCTENSECDEGYGCVEGQCVENLPPVFLSEPRWPYEYWPILSTDPANPHKPQSEHRLFFAYDDDGVGCQTTPDLYWMYRPVELQAGVPVPVGEWSIEVPGWSVMYYVLIEEPTIADTTGPGLFEFKMSVTDCAGLTTDSEDIYGKRYYFQVN